MAERSCLFVLPPSHYCERARWALDCMGIDYMEQSLAVGLHIPRARRMARATTLPILTTGKDIIQGSSAILDWTGITGGDSTIESRLEEQTGVLSRTRSVAERSLPGRASPNR